MKTVSAFDRAYCEKLGLETIQTIERKSTGLTRFIQYFRKKKELEHQELKNLLQTYMDKCEALIDEINSHRAEELFKSLEENDRY